MENPDAALSVVEAAGLDQATVLCYGSGGAPDVGLDHERAEGVGGDVVFGGVGGAVDFEGGFFGVVAALAFGQGQVRFAEVGAVKEDDAVVVEELHVHR